MESGRYSKFAVGIALFRGRGVQKEALNKLFRAIYLDVWRIIPVKRAATL